MAEERIEIVAPDDVLDGNAAAVRRLEAAHRLEEPDRVPVLANESQYTCLAARKRTFADYIRSPEDNLREQILNLRWRLETLRDDRPLPTESLTFRPDLGCLRGVEFPMQIIWQEDGPPKCVHPLQSLADIDRLSVPPPDGGLNQRYIEWYHRMRDAAERLDVRLNGRSLRINVTHRHGGGPIPAAFALAGANLFVWMLEDPRRAHRLMQIVTESHINCTRFFDRLCGRPAKHSVWLGCDTGEMISPKMFREFVAPYYYYNATKAQGALGGQPMGFPERELWKEAMSMDADTILRIKPALTEYLHLFDGCFGRITARRHLDTYVGGQLSDLPRKSIEPMADAAGTPPRDLQEFLGLYRWDESAMRDRLQERVARGHAHQHSVGILDETSFVKKGNKTACVQRQHCGAVGKTENCVVTVHLGYATPDFHTLLDADLYLPKETWHEDRARCRAAGIPDRVVYRPKWQIGLGQIRRARTNGLRFAWMTFDEAYGGKPPFLRALDEMGQCYVGEVPADFRVWTRPPAVRRRPDARPRTGRPRTFPRLKAGSLPPVEVQHVASCSPVFRRRDWQTYRVKEGHKGPMVWRGKHLRVWLADERGLPSGPYHLVVAYNVLEPETIKYFISNAPEDTAVETLLLVAFSRWKIERMFEDGKGEVGMDHFEVRKFRAIQRHLILSCVSYLFLAEFHQAHRGEKPGPDGGPGADGDGAAGAGVVSWGPVFAEVGRDDLLADPSHPAAQRQGGSQPPHAYSASIARDRPVSEEPTHLSVEPLVAL